MIKLPKLTVSFVFAFTFCSNIHGQNFQSTGNTGFINFNFGPTTYPPGKYQKVSLFGCNTSITDSVLTQISNNGIPNQLISSIPSGWQTQKGEKERYYVSKYYIASPPIMKNLNGDTLYDIGIVTPDEFDLIGEKPVQPVYMDYNVLKPVFIEYIPIEFDLTFRRSDTFAIPFRVEAIDFPWLDSNGLKGAKGASGIGYLKNDTTHTGRLFLPYYYSTKDSTKVYLNFQITILNDILLNNEVFFSIGNVLSTSINLKHYRDGIKKLKFSRKQKYERPCGCMEPERARLGDKLHLEKNPKSKHATPVK